MSLRFVLKMYKVCWNKEKEQILFQKTSLSIIRVSNTDLKSVEAKKINHLFEDTCLIFLTLVWLFLHVSYGCHTSVGHQRESDTATRLLLELFVLHRLEKYQLKVWGSLTLIKKIEIKHFISDRTTHQTS